MRGGIHRMRNSPNSQLGWTLSAVQVYTESALIADTLESEFPGPLLPPKGSEQRQAAEELLRYVRVHVSLVVTRLRLQTTRSPTERGRRGRSKRNDRKKYTARPGCL